MSHTTINRTAPARARRANLAGDFAGGLTGAMLSLPSTIGSGLIVFAPFGADGSGAGILSMMTGSIVGGICVALFSGTVGTAAGITPTLSLLLASLVSVTVGPTPGPEAIGTAIAAIVACTLLAGILLAGMGLIGVGRVVPLVPYPVLAGIVNGAAGLMIFSMAGRAIGLAQGDHWQAASAIVSAVVVALMFVPLPRQLQAIPRVLLAVLIATVLHHLLIRLLPSERIGPFLATLPPPTTIADNVSASFQLLQKIQPAHFLLVIAPVAVSIALVAALETLTVVSAVQEATRMPGDARRDLLATAGGNVLAALAGGTAISGSLNSSIPSIKAGGTTRLSTFLRSGFLLLATVGLGPVITLIPLSAMAGVVVSSAIRLFDLDGLALVGRTLRRGGKHRGEVLGSAAVIVLVAGIALHWSLVIAVGIGVLLSVAMFVTSMARGVVRRSYHNPGGRSRIRRTEQETATLLQQGRAIAVIEIEGAIFFGSAEHIARQIKAEAAAGAAYIILDMRRVSGIDLSGARRLVQICLRQWSDGVHLSLAHVRRGTTVGDYLDELNLFGSLQLERIFGSLDAALEEAEAALLTAAGQAEPLRLTPPTALQALRIPDSVIGLLLDRAEDVRFPQGETIIRAGDDAGAIFIIVAGRVDITLPLNAAGGDTRIATMTEGTMVGEMALLSGAPRSANAIARTDVECLRLDLHTIDLLRKENPAAAYHLLAAIALQVERNLRLANATIIGLEE